MLLECYTQYVRKFGKLNSVYRTGKCQFIPFPKKGNHKECLNYHTISHISHASKAMLKILQSRLQQHMNQELPDIQAGFQRGSGTRGQITNIHWIMEKAREFQKNIYSCFIGYTKAFDCGKFLKRWEYQTTLPVSWETCMQVNKQQLEQDMGTTDWSQTGEGVQKGCILSPCLINLYACKVHHVKCHARWITRWNQDCQEKYQLLRYADDTTLIAENKEELKSPLMKVKEESEKHGLKLNIRKTKIMASNPITSWYIEAGKLEAVTDFTFLGSKITENGYCSCEIKRHLLLGRKAMTNLDSILKSRYVTLPTNICVVKAMVFPVVMYGCESWTIKKVESWRIDGFKLWCWRRLLRVPWTAKDQTSQS